MASTRVGEVQYRHYRTVVRDPSDRLVPATRGGLTVAFRFMSPRTAEVGVAGCSPEDNFCKESGRETALQHLKNGPCGLSFSLAFPSSHDIIPGDEEVAEERLEMAVLTYLTTMFLKLVQAMETLEEHDFSVLEKKWGLPRWFPWYLRSRLDDILTETTYQVFGTWPYTMDSTYGNLIYEMLGVADDFIAD